MKKYLMILSSITATGVGAIANTISSETSKVKEQMIFESSISIDTIKYDVSNGADQVFALPELLNLIKDLNQYHKDNNVEFKIFGLPFWSLIDDNDHAIGSNWLNSIFNLISLINSNFVEFTGIELTVPGHPGNKLKAILIYKIADIQQGIDLFSYSGDMPSKQDAMKVRFATDYYWS